MISLAKVDGVEQIFLADFYLTSVWHEPSAKLDDVYSVDKFWNPRIEFINLDVLTRSTEDGSKTSFVDLPFTNQNNNDAAALCMSSDQRDETSTNQTHGLFSVDANRFSGRFTAQLEMQSFPKDTQILTLCIESAMWNESQARFYFGKQIQQRMCVHPFLPTYKWLDGKSYTIALLCIQQYMFIRPLHQASLCKHSRGLLLKYLFDEDPSFSTTKSLCLLLSWFPWPYRYLSSSRIMQTALWAQFPFSVE